MEHVSQSSAKLALVNNNNETNGASQVPADVQFAALAGQNQVLEMIATGRPVDDVLKALCVLAEQIEPDAVASVLVVDRRQRCFKRVVSPSLDEEFCKSLHGVSIDPPHLGTCGSAVYYGFPVISTDIATDERWHPAWRNQCVSRGLRSCQSTPIFGSDGKALGSFMLSFRQPMEKLSLSSDVVRIGTHLAGIALERELHSETLHAAERQKDEALALLNALIDHAPVGLALLEPEGRIVRINDMLAFDIGRDVDALCGQMLQELAPYLGRALEGAVAEVLATARPVSNIEVDWPTSGIDDGPRYMLASFYPVLRNDGGVAFVGMVVVEISERRRAEEKQKLLLVELNHRVRNTLAIVQSIATQTLGSLVSPRELVDTLLGRIHALANTHTLLSDSEWKGASLYDMVKQELGPYLKGGSGPQVHIEGPHVRLMPQSAQTFGLVLHEMATNAIKHGALASPSGHVDVTWSVEGEGKDARLNLVWVETGGPSVVTPNRSGFGHRLIDRGFPKELGGMAKLEFNPNGLRGHFSIRLSFQR